MLRPLHTHNCDKCRYLGQHMDNDGYAYDHYHCTSTGSLVARRSSEASDYQSISPALVDGRINWGRPLMVTHAVWKANLPCAVMIYPDQEEPKLRYRHPFATCHEPAEVDQMDKLVNDILQGKGGADALMKHLFPDHVPLHEMNRAMDYSINKLLAEHGIEQRPAHHYEVIYRDAGCDGGSFDCWAYNVEDAERLCKQETPGATVVGVREIIDATFKDDEPIQAMFEAPEPSTNVIGANKESEPEQTAFAFHTGPMPGFEEAHPDNEFDGDKPLDDATCIVMVGNMSSGYMCYGPFRDKLTADTWGESEYGRLGSDFLTMPLHHPQMYYSNNSGK